MSRLYLRHRCSVIGNKVKRAKGQNWSVGQSVTATREGLLLFKSYSDMVHRLRSNNKIRSNRKRSKRSSRYLKTVCRFICLGAPLKPPTDDGDKNGTADNANIVGQTTTSSISTLYHHKHRRGRMTDPATKLVPNDRGISTPAPQEYITTTMKQRQRQRQYNNDTSYNDEDRGVIPPPTRPKATGKIENKLLAVGRPSLPTITIDTGAIAIIKVKITPSISISAAVPTIYYPPSFQHK